MIIAICVFICCFTLSVSFLTLKNYRKRYYLRSYYGQKLLMRSDLTTIQREYIDYIVNCRSHESLMLSSMLTAPKRVITGIGNSISDCPQEIKDIWEDEMFDEFAKNDIAIWLKKHPMLSTVFCIELFVLAIISLLTSRFKSRLSQEEVYETSTFSSFERSVATAGC